MDKNVKSPEEVTIFLDTAKELLKDDTKFKMNIATWADGKVNKTQQYMAETGIERRQVVSVLQELTVRNYSSTKYDRNPYFKNEEVWEFGIKKNLVDQEEDLYIKLKIREIKGKRLLIMSFHPEKPAWPGAKLQFPYKGYEENMNSEAI